MPRKKNFKVEDVLQKALGLFWEKGFHATSMDDLVHTLGINRASMYDTFGSKEALFNKTIELYKVQEKERLINFFRQQSGVKQGFYNLFQQVAATSNAHRSVGCFVINTITELLPEHQNQIPALVDFQQEVEGLFVEFIDWGKSRNEIDVLKNTAALATALFAQYSGYQVLVKVNTNPEILHNSIPANLSVLD